MMNIMVAMTSNIMVSEDGDNHVVYDDSGDDDDDDNDDSDGGVVNVVG